MTQYAPQGRGDAAEHTQDIIERADPTYTALLCVDRISSTRKIVALEWMRDDVRSFILDQRGCVCTFRHLEKSDPSSTGFMIAPATIRGCYG